MRKLIKFLLSYFPFALTKNEKYDRLTKKILCKVLKQNSIAIDIGANEGKILKMICQYSPNSTHYAFEPIPKLSALLHKKFGKKVNISSIALSSKANKIEKFNLVKTNMAYSGLIKRPYDKPEIDEIIEVETNLLDNLIPATSKIDLIKLDTEGSELWILEGAVKTIKAHKPIILFEFGKKASQSYHYGFSEMNTFLSNTIHYEINTLNRFLKNKKPLSQQAFNDIYVSEKEYFFIATHNNLA